MPEIVAQTFAHRCVHGCGEFTMDQIKPDFTTLDFPCPECGKPLVGEFRPVYDFEIGLSHEKTAVGANGIHQQF